MLQTLVHILAYTVRTLLALVPILSISFCFWITHKSLHSYFKKTIYCIALIGITFTSYCYYWEAQQIIVKQEIIDVDFITENQQPITITLFADPHLGPLKNNQYLQRIVDIVNQQATDLILIPGDFLFEPQPEQIDTLLNPLQKLHAPAFAVSGNHDYGVQQTLYQPLLQALKKFNVTALENTTKTITIRNTQLTIAGFADLTHGSPEFTYPEPNTETTNLITLIHNPDHAPLLQPISDLLVAGHTHGGQIRIPYLYHYAIPTKGSFNRGLYEVNSQKLYITSGVGETLLPMRFLIPPEIVVITLR